MAKSSAATVIDLDAFRQRKQRMERSSEMTGSLPGVPASMFVPVWVCWVPCLVPTKTWDPLWPTPYVG